MIAPAFRIRISQRARRPAVDGYRSRCVPRSQVILGNALAPAASLHREFSHGGAEDTEKIPLLQSFRPPCSPSLRVKSAFSSAVTSHRAHRELPIQGAVVARARRARGSGRDRTHIPYSHKPTSPSPGGQRPPLNRSRGREAVDRVSNSLGIRRCRRRGGRLIHHEKVQRLRRLTSDGV